MPVSATGWACCPTRPRGGSDGARGCRGLHGREEIVNVVRALLTEEMRRARSLPEGTEQITTLAKSCHMYAAGAPDPDLILRTIDAPRLSGLLLWRSACGEYYFTDVLGVCALHYRWQ